MDFELKRLNKAEEILEYFRNEINKKIKLYQILRK